MKIVPWHCHVCGAEFDERRGGICSQCKNPTCIICLWFPLPPKLSDLRKPEVLICRSCKKLDKPNKSNR